MERNVIEETKKTSKVFYSDKGNVTRKYIAQFAWTSTEDGPCWWWLRSPGQNSRYAVGVGHTGVIGTYGTAVDQTVCGVRPILCIQAETMEVIEPETPAEEAEPLVNPEELATLQQGMKSEEVKELQNMLIEQGYLDDTADGDYGPKTKAAVQAFQETNGLEANGIADGYTRAALMQNVK